MSIEQPARDALAEIARGYMRDRSHLLQMRDTTVMMNGSDFFQKQIDALDEKIDEIKRGISGKTPFACNERGQVIVACTEGGVE
jgi:hypothetical protein